MRINRIKHAIIKTLCYSDIFDYPLRKSEIQKYFIGNASKSEIPKVLSQMVQDGMIGCLDGFYFLNGKEKLVKTRLAREKVSLRKLDLAKKTILLLSKIPTVKLIGISGSLSMKNSEEKDDIDLFLITSKNSLWITRFFVNFALILLGNKRLQSETLGTDRFCPNMFLSEDSLKITKRERNIFSAHEIIQLKPIFNRKHTYEHFINENLWVLNFLPNSTGRFKLQKTSNKGILGMKIVDYIFYKLQYQYMRGKMTIEKVTRSYALFHPKNKTNYVKMLYELKYKSYKKFVKRKSKNTQQNSYSLASNTTPGY